VPRSEILRVSELLATKLIENEFEAYINLQALMASQDALSKRGYIIASYALCGFANLGSLGIQIGVLSALAPSRARLIARIGASAMISGFISTLQTAGIACVSSHPPILMRSELNWVVTAVCLFNHEMSARLVQDGLVVTYEYDIIL
jgi:nucleoside permease NupC